MDYCGIWKTRQISDQYDDIQLDRIYFKVAQVLCPGVLVHCKVLDAAATHEWIYEIITPNICGVLGVGLGFLSGKALLWLDFSQHKDYLLKEMRNHITVEYGRIPTFDDGANPLVKKLVTVYGQDPHRFIGEENAPENISQDDVTASSSAIVRPNQNIPRDQLQVLVSIL